MTPFEAPWLTAETCGCARHRLAAIDGLTVTPNAPLAGYTRFRLGGPAMLLAEAATEAALVHAVRAVRELELPWTLLGGGTNVVAADAGYAGVVLIYRGTEVHCDGTTVTAQAGATLQALVDAALEHALEGLERMTGIPGSVGGAVYGNAGAYGQSVSDTLARVRSFDGESVAELDHAQCGFRYRDSLFKRTHTHLVLAAAFALRPAADPAAMRRASAEILATRNAKFPPEMACAGSVFKNLILAELPARAAAAVPPEVVKKGKVPAGWFLEQVGARGLRHGGIAVADYHANLIYNAGGATAAELRAVLDELRGRVEARFGLRLEEEVQYLGFAPRAGESAG
jgi:UDP-N-acetylmuramate dehydrogenase